MDLRSCLLPAPVDQQRSEAGPVDVEPVEQIQSAGKPRAFFVRKCFQIFQHSLPRCCSIPRDGSACQREPPLAIAKISAALAGHPRSLSIDNDNGVINKFAPRPGIALGIANHHKTTKAICLHPCVRILRGTIVRHRPLSFLSTSREKRSDCPELHSYSIHLNLRYLFLQGFD